MCSPEEIIKYGIKIEMNDKNKLSAQPIHCRDLQKCPYENIITIKWVELRNRGQIITLSVEGFLLLRSNICFDL